MGSIRIIQLSDLLVGPGFDSVQALKAFRACTHRYPLGHVDYLLICGNLTADGSSRSFRRAEELIGTLAHDILKDGGHRTRVMLVPGRNDIQLDRYAEPKYKQFTDFHDRFFAKQISGGVVAPFKPERPMYRELKDLTLLGVCHWNEGVVRTGGNGKIVFFDAVEQAANLAEDLHLKYRDGTPTVLVTAESPVLAWDVRLRLRSNDICEALNNRVRLTLHCFGASDTTCLSFEPFLYQHIGVSTGPRHNGCVWPLRFNVIELDSGNHHSDLSDYRRKEKRSSLRLAVYEQSAPKAQWHEGKVIDGGELNSALARRHPVPEPSVIHFRKLLAKLEGWLPEKHEGLALVTGAPGAGLRQLVNSPMDWQRIGGKWTRIVKAGWSEYEVMTEKINAALKVVRRRKDEIENTSPEDEHELPVVILSDEAYDEARKLPDDQWTKMMQSGIDLVSGECNAIFLWLIETLDRPPEGRHWSFGTIRISARDTDDLDGLMTEYAYRIPLDLETDGRLVNHLSGGYIGIAESLLREAQTKFSKWPGSFLMWKQVGRDLLEQTLQQEPLHEMISTKELVSVIRECPKGENILDFVHRSIEDRIGKRLSWNLADEAVIINVSELLEQSVYPGDDPKHVEHVEVLLRKDLNWLAEVALLEREDKDTYRVRALAPFLKVQIPFTVFLCYCSEDLGSAEDLKRMIEVSGSAEVKMFGLPKSFTAGSIIMNIDGALKKANNFVLLAMRTLTEWQEGEVMKWVEAWKGWRTSGNARPFIVAYQGVSIPVPLAAEAILHLEHFTLREAADKIRESLVLPPQS